MKTPIVLSLFFNIKTFIFVDMDSQNSDFDEIEDDKTTTNSKAQVPKPSTSRPAYKLRAKTKKQRTSKILFSKKELQVLSKTLINLMPSKDASTVGFDTKTKDNDDDRMDNDDETENLLRFIFLYKCYQNDAASHFSVRL